MGVTPGLMGLPTIGFPCSTLPYQKGRDAFYGESQKD
tara:strand:- start:491 stop:601 length:111 start_codon:yes stop_codon:yes gene_type:complete